MDALHHLAPAPPAFFVGDGPMRAALQAHVRPAGRDAGVAFTGWQRRPARWIAGAAVLAAPSVGQIG